MEVKAEYLAIFSEEASDQLREWEQSLLALEKSPGAKEPLNNMFRAIHTLKGSAGFIGFDSLQKMAHALESSLSSVRDGARPCDSVLGDLLFKGLDLARTMIDAFTNDPSPGGRTGADPDVESLLAKLAQAATASGASTTVAAAGQKATSPAVEANGESDGKDSSPVALKGLAAATGTSDPRRTSSLVVRIEGQNREAYMRSCLVKARLDRLGTVIGTEPSPEVLREATEPFVYTVTISAGADAQDLASAISIDQVSVVPASPAGAEVPRVSGGEAPAELARGSRPEEVVRVSVQKLDTLLNLVGELVIHNSGFVATTEQLKEQYGKAPFIYDLQQKTETLSAITRDLQAGIMKARMLPVANVV